MDTQHRAVRLRGKGATKSNQIKLNQIESNQMKSNWIKSNEIKLNQIKSNWIKSKTIDKMYQWEQAHVMKQILSGCCGHESMWWCDATNKHKLNERCTWRSTNHTSQCRNSQIYAHKRIEQWTNKWECLFKMKCSRLKKKGDIKFGANSNRDSNRLFFFTIAWSLVPYK